MLKTIAFPIPSNSHPAFFKKLGDHVAPDEPIFEYYESQDQVEIDISQKLNVEPKSAASLLLKNLGDLVEKDEVIARHKKGLIFKKTIELKSLIKGKVFELDNFSGKVKIIGVPTKKVFNSPFAGKVKDLDENQVVIEFKGVEVIPKKIFGESFSASIVKLSKCYEEIDHEEINVEMQGKVLYGGHFSLTDLNKAMAVGVRGIIAHSISDSVFEKFNNEKKFSFVSSNSQINLSIAVLDDEDANLFENLDHKDIYFDAKNGRIIIPQK